jgi:hypothetical protein
MKFLYYVLCLVAWWAFPVILYFQPSFGRTIWLVFDGVVFAVALTNVTWRRYE